jgi:broad specificity phosphatase PhoE
MKNLCLCLLLISLTGCSHTYYIVRHAEKAAPNSAMTTDIPLSDAGKERATALKEELKNKRIRMIFSTNTIRTKSTAEPLRSTLGLIIIEYGPRPDSAFIHRLKRLNSNVLIVGHSNTVDDIVNGLTNRQTIPGDLNDSAYNNLFVVKYRKFLGTRISFENKKFGR